MQNITSENVPSRPPSYLLTNPLFKNNATSLHNKLTLPNSPSKRAPDANKFINSKLAMAFYGVVKQQNSMLKF